MIRFMLIVTTLLLFGCSDLLDPAAFECVRSDECAGSALCLNGDCVYRASDRSSPDQEDGEGNGAADSAAETDDAAEQQTAAPRNAGPCATSRIPVAGDIVINEVLANPPAGDAGDANGDGVRHAFEDEFVELVNVADAPLEFGGGELRVGGTLRHTFEPLCILRGESLVVFGGGMIGPTVVGAAVTSDRRLGLPNDAGVVELIVGGVHETFTYDRAPAASLVRTPELTGTQWQSHLAISETPFSPGTCVDGSAMLTGCVVQPSSPQPDG